jgi:hypothetical protein
MEIHRNEGITSQIRPRCHHIPPQTFLLLAVSSNLGKLKSTYFIDTASEKFSSNLEYFLGVLQGLEYFYSSVEEGIDSGAKEALMWLRGIIKQAKEFLIGKCLNESNHSCGKEQGVFDDQPSVVGPGRCRQCRIHAGRCQSTRLQTTG